MAMWGKKIIDGDGAKRVSKIILRLCCNQNMIRYTVIVLKPYAN